MVATVNASTSAGVVITPDNSGVLALQSSSATALTIDASQNSTFVGTASATKLIPTGSSATGNGLYLPAANSLGLSTNGAEAMRIDSSGSVAIGSTSTASATRLTLKGAGTGGNTLLNCQDSGGTALLTLAENGNLSFNSGYGSNATAYGCRAWVNFNGTGTIAIRGSANVSSITDNGTGDYTMNFTTAMPDTGYSAVGTCGSPSVSHGIFMFVTGTGTITATSGVRFGTNQTNAVASDYVFICAAVFR